MIHGIGIDHCSISRIQRILDREGEDGAFFQRTFTAAERKEGAARHDTAAFCAARFAVKEAVYKALGWHNLDLREIESLHRENGSPYVFINQALFQAIDSCRIVALHLSVTTEGDTAAAFVVAEKSE